MKDSYERISQKYPNIKWKSCFGTLNERGEIDYSEAKIKKDWRRYTEQVIFLLTEIAVDFINTDQKFLNISKGQRESLLQDLRKKIRENILKGFHKQEEKVIKFISNLGYIWNRCLLENINFMYDLGVNPEYADADADAVAKHLKSGKSMVNFYVNFFKSLENVNELKEKWKKSDILEKRFEILSNALDLHYQENYIASIPLFLIHIDGIFGEVEIKKKDARLHERKKEVLCKIAEKVKENNVPTEMLKDSVLSIVIEEILNNRAKKSSNLYPNRHAVLHGEDLNYSSIEKSVRLITVIDGLRHSQLVKVK